MFKVTSICLLINLTLVALCLANQFLETSISNGYNKERDIGNHINITEPTEMKAIQGRDMSIWSYMNFLESMIMKYKNEALSYLDNLLNVPNNVLPTSIIFFYFILSLYIFIHTENNHFFFFSP